MDIGILSIGMLMWIILIIGLYFIGKFVVDKISERYCWLESSKKLGYIILSLIIGFFIGWIFIIIVVIFQFIDFLMTYKREKQLISLIESNKKVLYKLYELGFDGIGNLEECINFNFKGDDIYILNSILRNYKCRNLLDINIELSPGLVAKLADGTEWKKDFCN